MKKRMLISLEDARYIGESLYIDWDQVDLVQFRWELTGYDRTSAKAPLTDQAFVKVVLTHIKEIPDYFTRLSKLKEEVDEYQGLNSLHQGQNLF
jgi:hypothetical protein